jgi:taurine dioxygenase
LPWIGVQVLVDLNDVDRSEMLEITKLVAENKAVLIPEQNLSLERWEEINNWCGRNFVNGIWSEFEDHPSVMRITDKLVDGKHVGWLGRGLLDWHADSALLEDGEEVVGLYCIEADAKTWVTDFEKAYEELPNDVKEEIDQCTISFAYENNGGKWYDEKIYPRTRFEKLEFAKRGKKLPVQLSGKPLVKTHPVTGRKGLFFPHLVIGHLEGLSEARSNELLDYLVEHCFQDRFIYKHRWNRGDVLFMDQHHSVHKRWEYEGTRELWRTAFWYDDSLKGKR